MQRRATLLSTAGNYGVRNWEWIQQHNIHNLKMAHTQYRKLCLHILLPISSPKVALVPNYDNRNHEFNTSVSPCLLKLVSCWTHSSTMKMEAICSSETSVDFHRATRHYIQKTELFLKMCAHLQRLY
jgi:hypothetical protein